MRAGSLQDSPRQRVRPGYLPVAPIPPHRIPPEPYGGCSREPPGEYRACTQVAPGGSRWLPRSLPVAPQGVPGGLRRLPRSLPGCSPGCSRWPPAADGILGGSGGCFRGHLGGYRGVPGGTNVNFNYPNGEIRSKSPKILSLNAGLTSRKPQLQIPGYRFHRNPPVAPGSLPVYPRPQSTLHG